MAASSNSSSSASAALHFYEAIRNNDLDFLKRAVEVFKFDLNAKFTHVRKKNHIDLCPVHLVAFKGYLSMLHYLIQAGER